MNEQEKKSKTLEDRNLIASIQYLKKEGFFKEPLKKISFETVKEAEENAKETVLEIIKEKTNNLKQDISDLRKKGNDLSMESIKLFEIPLKTKVWIATKTLDDIKKIFEIIKSVENNVTPLVKTQEEKDKKKEEKQKEKEEKEELEAKKRDERLEKALQKTPLKKETPAEKKPEKEKTIKVAG